MCISPAPLETSLSSSQCDGAEFHGVAGLSPVLQLDLLPQLEGRAAVPGIRLREAGCQQSSGQPQAQKG